jgi:hypothetical protein
MQTPSAGGELSRSGRRLRAEANSLEPLAGILGERGQHFGISIRPDAERDHRRRDRFEQREVVPYTAAAVDGRPDDRVYDRADHGSVRDGQYKSMRPRKAP